MNTDGGSAGGGEILQYWGKLFLNNRDASTLNTGEIVSYLIVPFLQLIAIALVITVAVMILKKKLEIKSNKHGKGIRKALDYMDAIRQRDARILKTRRLVYRVTRIIESTPFALPKRQREYWNYNIQRAQIKLPGEEKCLSAEELHACIIGGTLATDLLLFLIGFVNPTLGFGSMLGVTLLAAVMPMRLIRATVAAKDEEIRLNFSDFYLMIHYVIIEGGKTPLSSVMKSYQKTTNSEEMKHFVDVCVHYIDTHGEYVATRYIAKEYREIPEVAKLMRLIRQSLDGGDVKAELIGFRNEIISAKKFELHKKMDKLVAKGRASFNLLMPILIQAILSATSIYLEDLVGVTSWI